MISKIKLIKIRAFSDTKLVKIGSQGLDTAFTRLINFDPESLTYLPKLLTPLEPSIDYLKEFYINYQAAFGLSNYTLIASVCIATRLIIFPIIFYQLKQYSRLAEFISIFEYIKKTINFDKNNTPKQKLKYIWPYIKLINKKEKINPIRIFSYNFIYIP